MIVEEFSGLNYICHQYTQKMFREILKSKTALSQYDIESVVQTLQGQDLHSVCNSLLSTEYQRRQYYQKNFPYVHPQRMCLGRDENRNQRYAQYIPLKNTLKTMLMDPVVWEQCAKHQHVNSSVFSDICDGSVFKSNDLSKQPEITIQLILYQDAFEIVNPLGSAKKRHKMIGVYFTLGNFEPFYRSCIDNIQLLLLCYDKDFNYFGQTKIFGKLLADVKELEEHGFVTSSGDIVRATIVAIIGDNLGSHCIGGYTQNFSTAKHCCRYCLVPRSELQNVCVDFPNRTVESYKAAVETLRTTEENVVNGLKFDSIFNSLKYFHVAQPGLPPCIGHDLFEGVVAIDLAIFLEYFVKRKWFSWTQLNRRLAQFKYVDSDAGSVPSQICEKRRKLGGQAAENWCLLRFLPIIIGDRVESQDPVWQLTVKLK